MYRTKRDVIVDECLSNRVCRYLKEAGMKVRRPVKGTKDSVIMEAAYDLGAYILTADGDFRNHRNALYVHPSMKPGRVYWMVDTLLRTEFDGH